MWSKLIVVLVALCVVKASVIINVFDEDPEITNSKSIHFGDCNYRACDQQCRNLGFTGGACVKGRCKCDINRNDNAEISETRSFHLRDCNYQACDQQCRNIGFTGGVCVNGRCKCDINKKEVPEIRRALSELGRSAYPFDCNPQACDQQCRNIGFTGGVCVHDRCKCDINKKEVPESTKSFAELAKYLYPRDCNFLACDQQCRNFGFPSGSCIDGRCECNNNKEAPPSVNDETTIEEEKFKDSKQAIASKLAFSLPRACDIFNCNDMCQRLNYVGGMCDMDGVCQCF